MITLAILEQRLQELLAGREQLLSQIMQAQANVNAFAGAIEEVTRLRDLAAAEAAPARAPEPHEGVN
ncbi:MAG: hypothetical protein KAX65_00200 [Caldilineaceae bacterium]|nr:hypothetical protein [Caldilineaceae bacterium]